MTTTSDIVPLAKEYAKYLYDANMYPQCTQQYTRAQVPHTGLTKEEERMMSGKWIIMDLENVKSTVHTHKVPEPIKDRSRVVHACRINEMMDSMENQPPSYSLKSPSEINAIMSNATMVVQYDAKSMYDQFMLEEIISRFFCFQTHNNTISACAAMPMGFTKACGVAQSLSTIVAQFDTEDGHYKVYVIIHLDNYCYVFVAKYQNPPIEKLKDIVTKTINTFLKRTNSVDLQLNEMNREEIQSHLRKTQQAQWETLVSMSPNVFTFLGIKYDIVAKTKTAGDKTWQKLESIMACIYPLGVMNPNTTPRMLAMLMGCLGYITRTCELKHTFYNLYRTISELCAITWTYPQAWDIPLTEVTLMFSEIPRLVEMVKRKKMSPIYPLPYEHSTTMIIITDASHIGWGGIICAPTGEKDEWKISVEADYWPLIGGKTDPLYESSTLAEPKAIRKTAERLQIPQNIKHIIFVTDHSPLVSASRSTQARCYTYFDTLSWLERQQYTYSFLFIPGTLNPADCSSRNPQNKKYQKEEIYKIAKAAGMGYARALQLPNKEILPSVCVSNDDLSLLSGSL